MRLPVRRTLALLVAAPLAFVAIAAAAPAAGAGGYGASVYGGDKATFSITIGGYGADHGVRQGPRARQPHADARRHRGPRREYRQYRRSDGHGHSHGNADRHSRTYGRTDGSHYRAPRYAGRGVGYRCHIAYRHGQPVTVCRDCYGVPFIVGNRY